MSHKYVYLFSEGNENMRELLGGKGANLAEMTSIGLPGQAWHACPPRLYRFHGGLHALL